MTRAGILFLLLILSLQVAFAQNESSSLYSGIYRVDRIDIELKPNGVAEVREELVVDSKSVRILLPKTSQLNVRSTEGELEYTTDVIHDEQVVSFESSSHFPESDGTVWISYVSDHLTEKSGSIWTLRFSSFATPAHTEVGLEFPPNSNVISVKPDIPKYPKNLSNPLLLYPQDRRFSFDCEYEVGEMEERAIPLELITIGVVITLAAITLLVFVLRGRKSEEKAKEDKPEEEKVEKEKRIKDSVTKMLDERERRIIEVIEASGEEETTQAYVYKTTGIPKATLSDIMKRLENRNIIERTNEGRNKWIKIKKWVFY